MTMSHLLKQTKKCCVKIIRKLSFNPSATTTNGGGGTGVDQSPTNNGHGGLNNRITAKYVLHKNCTPTRCKVQPCESSSFDDDAHHHAPSDGWFETEATGGGGPAGFYPLAEEPEVLRRSSSPARTTPAIPETQNNYKLSRNAKNLPKKRTNITSNKNVNLRKCFRLRSKTFDGVAPGPLEVESSVAQTAGSMASMEEGVQHQHQLQQQQQQQQETSDSQTLASNNSSSRLIGAKLDKISKSLMRSSASEGEMAAAAATAANNDHHHYGGGGLTKISKPLFLTAKKCGRRSNYNHIEVDAGDDEFDELEESGHHTLEPRWEALSGLAEELVLTSAQEELRTQGRRERLVEQETTLSVEEPAAMVMAASNAPSVLERLTVAETAAAILFEKVKYDRTKRYLIDQLTEAETHSNSDGGSPAPPLGHYQLSSSCSSSPFHLAMAAAAVASKSEDFVDPWKNYNIRGGASWDKVSKSPWDSSAKASPVRCSSGVPPATCHSPHTAHPQQQAYPTRTHWNPFEYSPAHLSRLAAAAAAAATTQQPAQSQPASPQRRPPQQQQQQYRPAFQVQTDVWENLNNKHYEIDTDVVWRSTRCSSRRTSASTVETWIDDETFDNSFNEELERRCTTLKICE